MRRAPPFAKNAAVRPVRVDFETEPVNGRALDVSRAGRDMQTAEFLETCPILVGSNFCCVSVVFLRAADS